MTRQRSQGGPSARGRWAAGFPGLAECSGTGGGSVSAADSTGAYLGDQPVTVVPDGLDVPGLARAVAEHPAQFRDGPGQDLLADHRVAPHLVQQAQPRDHLARLFGQDQQHPHDARLDLDVTLRTADPVQGRLNQPLVQAERWWKISWVIHRHDR